MTAIDYFIILLYFVALLALGWTLGKKIKSSNEMFLAGRNSSWWLSGLSSYMTLFSAGTFVVWGGIAYKSGIVAVVLSMTGGGIASILVGLFFAGKWQRMKIDSPAGYLGIRFGQSTIRFYTIVGFVGRGVTMAVALYAVAIMAVALMPLPEGHALADPQTGHLSVTWAILLLGAITFIYTAAGGFVAVLMTDVIQFAVLMAMVIIMVPLSIGSVGGLGEFVSRAPGGFFFPVSSQFSWGWMILWCLLNAFMIGGDWPYVQRYLSVPSPRDAKLSIYLVGALFLATPLIWYLPAMIYRVIDPNANPEQAYMLMSQRVLGAGMLGLMLAAMMSATMSLVSGTLNVFANVFTCDIYKVLRPSASDKSMLLAGRVFSYAYGLAITALAILIPHLGGAERFAVASLTVVISPLFIPAIWGLFSRRIGQKSVFGAMGATYLAAFLAKTGLIFEDYVSRHVEFVDAFIGLVFPVAVLLLMELVLWKKAKAPGWERLAGILTGEKEMADEGRSEKNKEAGRIYSRMAFNLLTGTYAAIGLIMMIMTLAGKGDGGRLLLYGSIFLGVSLAAFLFARLARVGKNTVNTNNNTQH